MHGAWLALALLKLALRVEAGPDFDSNVARVENPRPNGYDLAPVSSFLVRGAVRGKLAWTSGATALRLGLDVGTKLFLEPMAASQDMVVGRLSAEARHDLGRLSLLALVDYHESAQWIECPPQMTADGSNFAAIDSCHRDFRHAALRAGATWRDGAPSVGGELQVRSYEWKPLEEQTFVGLGGGLTSALRLRSGAEREHEWTLALAQRLEWRRYQGQARRTASDDIDPAAPRRTDLVASIGVSASYLGRAFVSVGWFLEADRSTSFDGSLLYQVVTVETAVPLPARFTLGARAQLLYFSSGFLDASLAVDDENRDAFLVDLVRDFDHGLSLRARFQRFASAPGAHSNGYQRNLGTLQLTWHIP